MFRSKISQFFLLIFSIELIQGANLVCFYDSSSFLREGPAQLTLTQLEPALQFCNYLIYGYAGIDPHTYQLKSLNDKLDVTHGHYRAITQLKLKYPQLRVLLSVGGDQDLQEAPGGQGNKYLQLLEEQQNRQAFVQSVVAVINTYGFDGVDLAWQFPKNFPKEIQSGLRKAWSKIKGWFTGAKVVDEKAEQHKQDFTALIRELRSTFGYNGPIISLTMLPNVDSSLFVDVFTVSANVDFVNLAAFDFQTPIRDPKVADHSAPLYAMYERDPTHNVDYQVQYWLNQSAAASIINVGITTYGRAWIMSRNSGITGYPPVPETEGAAPGGKQINEPGLLSWPEICDKLHTFGNNNNREPYADNADNPLRKVGDPTNRYGIYAYRSADESGLNGIWVSYEDPTSAGQKAGYVHARGLGGVALFELSLDDFRGSCAGEIYPILRSIKYRL